MTLAVRLGDPRTRALYVFLWSAPGRPGRRRARDHLVGALALAYVLPAARAVSSSDARRAWRWSRSCS